MSSLNVSGEHLMEDVEDVAALPTSPAVLIPISLQHNPPAPLPPHHPNVIPFLTSTPSSVSSSNDGIVHQPPPLTTQPKKSILKRKSVNLAEQLTHTTANNNPFSNHSHTGDSTSGNCLAVLAGSAASHSNPSSLANVSASTSPSFSSTASSSSSSAAAAAASSASVAASSILTSANLSSIPNSSSSLSDSPSLSSTTLSRKRSSPTVASSNRLNWDEANLYQNDIERLERGPRMKINEPKTPYLAPKDINIHIEESDDEEKKNQHTHTTQLQNNQKPMSDDSLNVSTEHDTQNTQQETAQPTKQTNNEFSLSNEKLTDISNAALQRRLDEWEDSDDDFSQAHISRKHRVSLSNSSMDRTHDRDNYCSSSEDEVEKHRKFEQRRKQHYNMGQLLKMKMKAQKQEDDDEDEDDDDDEEEKNDSSKKKNTKNESDEED